MHFHRHDHDHQHGAEHAALDEPGPPRRSGAALRLALAAVVAGVFVVAACLVLVDPGEGVVITRFGKPVRVVTSPGLVWRLPPPVDTVTRVDLRLRTTSTGLQDVGTRDGLRILVQAYAAWQVPAEGERIAQFLRAVRNQPDEAAEQLRSFLRSALEIAASSFELGALVNTDPAKVRLAQFEAELRGRLEAQVLSTYGVGLRQVGIESLTLPAETLAATVARMRAERQTEATQRMAEGDRIAAEVRAAAERDGRVTVAHAREEAAAVDARARVEAAGITARAYAENPELYVMLRSFDTLDAVVGQNARLVLRTDAAPFRALVDGPAGGGNPP
ncbi:MAG: protease modulator HflC [Alphaproteobacteria bacterium]|nr:protease modulator HflC [Alphaproteobacteria bacterium]